VVFWLLPNYYLLNSSFYLHYFVALFIFTSVINSYSNYTIWLPTDNKYIISYLGDLQKVLLKSYSTATNFLELKINLLLNNSLPVSYFNFFLTSTSPEVNSLFLFTSGQQVNQSLIGNDNFYQVFLTNISDLGLLPQLSIFITTLILLISSYRKYLLIIF
jgi:hypothetical protein